MDSPDNLAIVQRTYAAVGQGDIPGLLELVSDDVEWTLQGPASIPLRPPPSGGSPGRWLGLGLSS